VNAQDEHVFTLILDRYLDPAKYTKGRVLEIQFLHPLPRDEAIVIGKDQSIESMNDGSPDHLFLAIPGASRTLLCVYVQINFHKRPLG
jgi:hypothetical protein